MKHKTKKTDQINKIKYPSKEPKTYQLLHATEGVQYLTVVVV